MHSFTHSHLELSVCDAQFHTHTQSFGVYVMKILYIFESEKVLVALFLFTNIGDFIVSSEWAAKIWDLIKWKIKMPVTCSITHICTKAPLLLLQTGLKCEFIIPLMAQKQTTFVWFEWDLQLKIRINAGSGILCAPTHMMWQSQRPDIDLMMAK